MEEEIWEILLIKRLLKYGRTKQREIGKMFNVSELIISRIKLGRTWKHIQV
ncbi:MAG: hypothetical protein M0R74_19355 [Dehalococcoidia bacterium]|nr:hypothetical protein [Dehalococcoidia bacterium]